MRIGSMACMTLAASLLLLGTARAAPDPRRNLLELHRDAAKSSNRECLSCHASILKGRTLDAKIKTFHRLHLESKRDTPKDCSACHASVDLREGSAAALRKQVDPGICAACHGGGVEGAKTLFAQ